MERNIDSSPIPFRNHTALLLSAALPYLQPAYRHPVELAMKFLEFTETLKLYQEFHMTKGSLFYSPPQDTPQTNKETGLFGLINTFILDIEGLLNSLSSVCTGDEKEIIGMFLNIVRVKNFYETYSDLIKMPMMFTPESNHSSMSETTSEKTEESSYVTPSDEDTYKENPIQEPTPESLSNIPFFPSDLTSMLNDDQKETLDLLKSLFSEES